ncbi:MAG: DUF2079 domain-containing protein [Lentisphaeria bacterium]|nr:DUF2079 domain-containing protein [Lentisphaeria bacterium]
MNRKISDLVKSLFLIFLPFISAGFPVRIFSLEYVDQRYHILAYQPYSARVVICGIVLMALLFSGEYLLLKKRGIPDIIQRIFSANKLLFLWGIAWIFPLNYSVLPLYIFCGAWSIAGFFSSAGIWWNLSNKKALLIAGCAALIAGVSGGLWQVWSFNHLGMQWFDWGHFYEVLINTLKGKFFYLDLEGGCFLASRFCISLLVLLPVAMVHSPELFLITGAVLVASGALMITWSAGKLRLPMDMALICGVGFLLLPGTLNMMLAQLDGFHEVFLLVPVVFGAWGAYRAGHKKLAIALWIFSLGIRETIGFMWVMWGIILLFDREKRRDGISLAVVSGVWTILLLTLIMPAISNHDYGHTVFFPHLGNSLAEVALSPVLKPGIFWGRLFSLHNLEFWSGLLLPFIFVLIVRPVYLLALLPDLVMISHDFRFDTQNLLRHYQIVPLLVLTIGAVESIACLYNDPDAKVASFLQKITGSDPAKFVMSYFVSGGILLSCCFAQIPLFPASDPRLLQWSDAREVINEFYELIPPDTPVTAGPTVASFFAGRNELSIYTGVQKNLKSDHVILESFSAAGGENALRIKLFASGEWDVAHSAYIDDRLLQLFIRREKSLAPAPAVPESMRLMNDKLWQNWGTKIPLSGAPVSLKGNIFGKNLFIAIRVDRKIETDLAFTVEIKYENGEKVTFFQAFGDGVYPAVFAAEKDIWLMSIPLEGKPVRCKVDMMKVPLESFPYITYSCRSEY